MPALKTGLAFLLVCTSLEAKLEIFLRLFSKRAMTMATRLQTAYLEKKTANKRQLHGNCAIYAEMLQMLDWKYISLSFSSSINIIISFLEIIS